ncbi:sarcosine oxidase subunit gamma [Paracoccus sp. Z330]|uniref:Sarcosine oxidase subunit gamma n=1 Tax=Paracoccus onchidii TaxID=3017813 RepID=A0ABT4ZAQ9_9RHOB|nr:sarcosine oxidase subunit gamma family protein [Paracoccus onchidii]MDB6176451.1 sarcosine oxidase subunit gamma [Paracoccus onchidii]
MAEALATIRRVEGMGMITLRGALEQIGPVVSDVTGIALPECRKITGAGDRQLGWMSPDELLCVMPVADLPAILAALQDGLTDRHALVLDMSDARVIYDIIGAHAEDVLAKLSPADLGAVGSDDLRRSRAAQTAAAFWRIESGFRVIGFRSTADYLGALLHNAAMPGSQLAPR